MQLFSLRFDIDSRRCLLRGTPNLLRLADELDVRFTFFALMGRPIARRLALRRAASPRSAQSLSVRQRLGVRDALTTFLRNAPVGASHASALAGVAARGHEVGLQGGRNHADWEREAATWARERLAAEIDWGIGQLGRAGIRPVGFASPTWVESPHLGSVLAERGFAYVAGRAGQAFDGSLPCVQTGILGEPGGVGYLEWLGARGLDDAAARDDFRARLRAAGEQAVAYDHPSWAGTADLSRVRMLVEVAREEGFDVVPLRRLV